MSQETDLQTVVRAAGGIVHRDGNIFFTSTEQFLEAARAALSTAAAHPPLPPGWVVVPLTTEQIEAIAHRTAWRYKKSSDPHHSDTYTFNRHTLIDFVRAITSVQGAPHGK